MFFDRIYYIFFFFFFFSSQHFKRGGALAPSMDAPPLSLNHLNGVSIMQRAIGYQISTSPKCCCNAISSSMAITSTSDKIPPTTQPPAVFCESKLKIAMSSSDIDNYVATSMKNSEKERVDEWQHYWKHMQFDGQFNIYKKKRRQGLQLIS